RELELAAVADDPLARNGATRHLAGIVADRDGAAGDRLTRAGVEVIQYQLVRRAELDHLARRKVLQEIHSGRGPRHLLDHRHGRIRKRRRRQERKSGDGEQGELLSQFHVTPTRWMT